jgi:RimJ/RimL family protein N-acetyltransferase
MFSVCLKEQRPSQFINAIGVVGLNSYGKAHYVFHPSIWGSGYCTEALSAFMNILFEYQPDRMLLKAIVLEGNLASRRVLEKCNFKIEPLKNTLKRMTYSRTNEDAQSSTTQHEPDIDQQQFTFYTYHRP